MGLEGNTICDPRDHVIYLYDGERELIAAVGDDLGGALRSGGIAIAIATTDHLAALDHEFAEQGIDAAAARARRDLVTADAASMLARFMVDGVPQREAFVQVIGSIVRDAVRAGRPVRIYGEMVTLLWEAGAVLAALDVERFWNELRAEAPFVLSCAYHTGALTTAEHASLAADLCALHSGLVGSDPAPVRSLAIPRQVSQTFEASPHASRGARRFVADALRRWGRHELVDDAVVVVSELTTNGVVHGHSDVEVTLAVEGDSVRISVRDGAAASPVVRSPGSADPNGRGLVLVAALAHAWGTEPTDGGKVVWAELR